MLELRPPVGGALFIGIVGDPHEFVALPDFFFAACEFELAFRGLETAGCEGAREGEGAEGEAVDGFVAGKECRGEFTTGFRIPFWGERVDCDDVGDGGWVDHVVRAEGDGAEGEVYGAEVLELDDGLFGGFNVGPLVKGFGLVVVEL